MIEEKTASLTVSEPIKTSNPWVKAVANKLQGIKGGRIFVTLPSGENIVLGEKGENNLQASIILRNYRPLSRFIINGDLGWAESYMDGEWECPDLTSLFKIALINEDAFTLQERGGFVRRTMYRLRHLLNANSKKGSKRNISYHYDMGNEFYKTWLDETMTYSSALFDHKDQSLADAQVHKNRTIAEMAGIKAGDKVLEVGCGWGGFSQLCAQEFGASVHGLTLSREQLAYAQNRYKECAIDHMATASLTDYRDCQGQFDKIVSIEMFEAVGEENWDTYFNMVYDRLKPGGTAVLQVIVIEDHRFETYRKNVDFIQRYIFPGGMLPSVEAMSNAVGEHGLKLDETKLFGQSYAKTCEIWQKSFQHAWNDVKSQGFDARFKRMWEYYLSYCEAGFSEGTIDVGLFKIVKPA